MSVTNLIFTCFYAQLPASHAFAQSGDTALIKAAKNGLLDNVKILLERGANIQHQDEVMSQLISGFCNKCEQLLDDMKRFLESCVRIRDKIYSPNVTMSDSKPYETLFSSPSYAGSNMVGQRSYAQSGMHISTLRNCYSNMV